MSFVSRLGDLNDGGGALTMGVPNVLTNGLPTVTAPGMVVSPHFCCGFPGCEAHCVAVTAIGNFTVLVAGLPINFVGCFDSCLHNRVTGALNVLTSGAVPETSGPLDANAVAQQLSGSF